MPAISTSLQVSTPLWDSSLRIDAFNPVVLSINRTSLSDGEAVHLVNRYCNIFPHIPTRPREGLIARVRPAKDVKRVTWLSPETGTFVLEHEKLERERHGPLRPALVRELLLEHFAERFHFERPALFFNDPILQRWAPPICHSLR